MRKPRKLKMLSPIPRVRYNLIISKIRFNLFSKYADKVMINGAGVTEPFFKEGKLK